MASDAHMNDADTTQIQVDVGIVKSQVADQGRKLDRIEKKIDAMTYVAKEDFETFKKEVKETFVTKDDFKPVKTLFWAIITTLITSVLGAVVGFAVLGAR